MWCSGKNLPYLQKKLQLYIYEIEKWCKKWFVKINADKTQLICFHRKKSIMPINVTLFNTKLNIVNEIKFLGVTFDAKLNWTSHIQNIEATMFRKINILRSLTGKNWGAKGCDMVHIYRAWALPNITYGCVAFLTVSDKGLSKIQVLQNTLIRSAFKLPRDTPIRYLHERANIIKIREHMNYVSSTTFNRIKRHEIVQYSVGKYLQIDQHTEHKCPLDVLRMENVLQPP